MAYDVKRLNANDLSDMRSLNALFGDVFQDFSSYYRKPPTDEYIRKFLVDSTHIVVVAKKDGVIIGGLVAYVFDKFEQQRKEVYLYDLAVSGDHRRHGIGRRLVEEVKSIAKRIGAYVVFVQGDEGDEAILFYESLRPNGNSRTRSFDFNV